VICPFKTRKRVDYAPRGQLRITEKPSIAPRRFNRPSTSEPAVWDDYITDARYVVDGVESV
jgi:hypothetical protein